MNKKMIMKAGGFIILVMLMMGQIVFAQEICGKYDAVQVNGGEYTVQNNCWGSDARQCINVNGTGFTVTVSEHNQGSVASYPSIYKGCHWGDCTANSGLPLQINTISSAQFTYEVSSNRPSGTYNVSAEAWISPSADSSMGYDGGAEIMIWLDNSGMYPAGSQIGTFDGHDVYYSDIGWNFLTYVKTGRSSASGDIMAFINDAMSRGYVQPNWYLHVFEAGFELMVGGAGLQVTNFSFSAQTGSQSTPDPTNPPTVTNPPNTNPPATNPPATNPPITNPPQPGEGDVWIVPENQNVRTSTIFNVQIHANTGSQRLGAYGFDLSYDSAYVVANTSIGTEGVEAGPDGFISAVNSSNNGIIRMSGFDTNGKGPGTDLHVLTVNLYAQQNRGTTYLGLDIIDFTNLDTVPIGNPNGRGANVTISDVKVGDVNGDGNVNITDALLTAQYYVGLQPSGFNADAADANCDGQINITDALRIAQYYVGLISQLC
ncbi:MAG: hypothetical protein JW881_20925 [Spirochaetales bacterium]|nr:hypothetical protein [Spirochaetales bacterium]